MIAIVVVVANFEEKRAGKRGREVCFPHTSTVTNSQPPAGQVNHTPLDTCPEVGEFLKLTELYKVIPPPYTFPRLSYKILQFRSLRA